MTLKCSKCGSFFSSKDGGFRCQECERAFCPECEEEQRRNVDRLFGTMSESLTMVRCEACARAKLLEAVFHKQGERR